MKHREHRGDGDPLGIDEADRLCFVDDEEVPDDELNAITNAIIAAAIAVHRALGPGFLEAVYEAALEIEFKRRGIKFVRQHRFEVCYEAVVVGEGRLDFLVEDRVVVELKSVEAVSKLHKSVVQSYLRATGKKLALILNFRVFLLKDGITRLAN
jgi:GxxExxY protein